ncbi:MULTISPECIES: aminoglycoside 6-adenylyltransferase [Enterococcus]|uniref:Aminoglycoside 6-adenylyltransferase n=1 Tax=Enterococcus dispar ATCC 51266 TaxID=1139219 RepID=S1N7H6_9ENTE|nr:aminoglycoside 6-adenylyltransferase [Enterococcus dispar]EOT42572.1 hypothetical protein OMK_00932 [Enterococcus dispar ATCC 51266]EOW84977.1 hypothetical protein I569_00267 [Enterococcus dispar ATCC 51266]MCU7356115.1 aminoglycoside 6-adenylyltransferase [Enterococcus dispar]MDT2704833.1 aminoglycoside 6-adenylyltransferase [Enterococcus dispar]OJG38058.1 hypothetical protein RV01_GL000601 [Enterococcus dispar]
MRTEKEMLARIKQVAKNLPQVKAVAISGSRVNPQAPKDIFQDYDIVYVVDEKESLLKERSWLKDFGEILIMQCPEEMTLFPATLGDCFTFLMLFTDNNRIDLLLCPIKSLSDWLKTEKIVMPLWDPQNLLSDLKKTNAAGYLLMPPSQEEFADCCNEFWWVSTYIVKGLWRQETLYATDHLYGICQKELRRLLSWQVAFEHRFTISIGKNDKYLLKYLNEQTQQLLLELMDFTTNEKIWQSLDKTQKIFHETALKLASITGFSYDAKTAISVQNYCQQWHLVSNIG